jgi:hypothetical protein
MDRECPNCHELVDTYNWSGAAKMCKPCLEQLELCAPVLLEVCEEALSFLNAPVQIAAAKKDLVAKLRAAVEIARDRKS